METLTTLITIALGLALLVVYRRKTSLSNPRRLPPPPGPKPDLIIGNARHIPPTNAWLTFTEWKKTYGDIVHLEVPGQHIIVINSYKVASKLLGQKLAYADRPAFQMVGELMGWSRMVSLMRYGDGWKRRRKLIHPAMHKTAIKVHWPEQQREARELLRNLCERPNDFMKDIRTTIGKLIMLAVYGISVKSAEDKYIVMAEKALATVAQVASLGNSLVNIFPILKFVPQWFPGAGFKRRALAWRVTTEKMVDYPFAEVKQKLASGTATPSFTANALQNGGVTDEDVKWASGTMYAAGSDTTGTLLSSFVLAMALYPDVQRKAQAELDRVTQKQRLPTFLDRPDLPYIECLIKELLRWSVITPLSVPHALSEDDYYEGYWIPKGSTILPNVWAFSKDADMYPEPEQFIPERFEGEAGKKVLDPTNYAFGFGRRICAGQNFADAVLYISIVSILAAINISKHRDESGNEVEPEVSYSAGMINQVNPFKCSIKPRSDAARVLMQEV
ncbi:hypothetical protein BOTBODRAFT_141195 [Botryobasidium botryosum FD-172 SS1]|uniref:Cytochrome P450 n=1 Tax=Botryobasidium botryosum (strain FD-172 SS1) TaxID=930990 RepID=A0A067M3T2_BOTB1|nr:hypothetical protein BOTBODRAFT_141195 [Botryobasidium botryosum FD-172 SS1]